MVYPVEIVGKRIRVKAEGKQLIKVHLDKNEQTNIEHKVCLHGVSRVIKSHIKYIYRLYRRHTCTAICNFKDSLLFFLG